MKVLELGPDYDVGLFDSDGGASLVTEKAVDITEECPSRERTLLLFTRAKRGPIVQIRRPYPGHASFGSHIHFFINELGADVAARDDSFATTAQRAGLTKVALRQLIDTAAPPSPGR